MHSISGLVALATTFTSAMAAVQGFNYGSTFTTGAPKHQSDFENEFSAAASLDGAPGDGFHSARLYTTVQGGTANDPISAIPAAIKTQTTLLLGIWASAGDAVFANELQALKSAISTYGSEFSSIVVGISVGSEDLYRISPTGIQNKENPGAGPDTIAGYIKRVREAISGTTLANAPIGHVDTWTAWVNSSNRAVVDASDWIGFDAYPYFQGTAANDVSNSKNLFDEAFQATKDMTNGKPIWITETGYPVSGKTVGQAVASVENAETYWNEIGCPRFGNSHIWWYTFQDAAPETPNPSFGIIGSALTSKPLFDISCKKETSVKPPPAAASSSSSDAPATSTKSEAGASSSSDAESSSTSAPAIGGGSPGAGGALPGSQLSLETSTLSSSTTAPSGTGSAGPSSTDGSSSEPGANSTVSGTSSPTPSTTGPATVGDGSGSGAGSLSGSIGLLAVALVAALAV